MRAQPAAHTLRKLQPPSSFISCLSLASLQFALDGSFAWRPVFQPTLDGRRYRSGPSTAWVKAKCYDTGVFDIIGVQRERGKPAMVLMQNEGRYIGGAFVTLPKGVRERLWARVQSKTGAKPPKGLAADKAEWLLPGLRGRVRYLRGEESLRHAHLQSFEEIDDGPES